MPPPFRQSRHYRDVLANLLARSASAGIKLDLGCMHALLAALGNPHAHLRCVIVAGTNGKGSTSALIAAALQRAGHRVGLYTSPHLLRFSERIRVDGEEISPERIATLAETIFAKEAACPRRPTFFECATVMALQHFADCAVDVVVLEVGLGGRLDATNVAPRVLSVITPVDLDHQMFLGDTLAAIAGEKAGIIVDGVPVVMAPQPPDAARIIAEKARACRAPVHQVEELSAASGTTGAWQPAFLRRNAATARAACSQLDAQGLSCPTEAFDAALAAFAWPGRYQWLDGTPPVLLDGAHNPAGCVALRDSLMADPRIQGRPVHLVFTAVHGKDGQSMLDILAPITASVHVCPVGSQRTRSSAELATLAMNAQAHADAQEALSAARAQAGHTGCVVVAGSLFLVADVLAILQPAPRDPPVDG